MFLHIGHYQKMTIPNQMFTQLEKELDETDQINESISDIIKSRLSNFAKNYIFKPTPILIFYNPRTEQIIELKIRRGIFSHKLIQQEGSKQRTLHQSMVGSRLVLLLVKEAIKLKSKGWIEI